MKVYRATFNSEAHDGYQYYATKKEAEQSQKDFNENNDRTDEIEIIEFEPTKKGIVSMLNIHCSYPDNG